MISPLPFLVCALLMYMLNRHTPANSGFVAQMFVAWAGMLAGIMAPRFLGNVGAKQAAAAASSTPNTTALAQQYEVQLREAQDLINDQQQAINQGQMYIRSLQQQQNKIQQQQELEEEEDIPDSPEVPTGGHGRLENNDRPRPPELEPMSIKELKSGRGNAPSDHPSLDRVDKKSKVLSKSKQLNSMFESK